MVVEMTMTMTRHRRAVHALVPHRLWFGAAAIRMAMMRRRDLEAVRRLRPHLLRSLLRGLHRASQGRPPRVHPARVMHRCSLLCAVMGLWHLTSALLAQLALRRAVRSIRRVSPLPHLQLRHLGFALLSTRCTALPSSTCQRAAVDSSLWSTCPMVLVLFGLPHLWVLTCSCVCASHEHWRLGTPRSSATSGALLGALPSGALSQPSSPARRRASGLVSMPWMSAL